MTKGLHILSSPIILDCKQTGQPINYLLIDSEGIGSCQQSLKYDMDLLILIFLISSTVVYNSIGAIDQVSLQQLQAVLKLKNCVQNTEHQYQDCTYRYTSGPPKFIWVLRDFALQLIDKNGKQMTSDQYLQQCLEQSSNNSNPQSRKKNQIRRAIKQNLGQRHCYTLVRPTIKQQDLQHLATIKPQNLKLRSQFIGQLQCLKSSLFTGSQSDIKKINNQNISGKLFSRILSQYLQIINNNKLPKVQDVWTSVLKQQNQQYFQQQMQLLKKQLKSIKLPLSKQQLKLKINQIQNRIYKNLQKNICNQKQLKNYHQEYLTLVQKLNKQIKQRNNQLRKNTLINQLHYFVKQNLNYQAIKPYNLAQIMKQFIQRIQYKINGAQQGYQYLLSIVNDIFFIVQQKASKMQRQLSQLKLLYQNISLDKTNVDLTLINLKRQYHDSLKTIAKLQQNQADIDKNYILNNNKIINYETKIIKLQAQLKQQKQIYDNNYKNIQQKNKIKIQQIIQQLKRIKQQNQKLIQQLSQSKQKLRQQNLNNKKQYIFQQKIRESFDKFHEQRINLQKQIQMYKKQINNINQKYTQLKDIYEKQCQKQKIIQQQYIKKQQNFTKQFQNLKQTFKQTRASYQKTCQIYQSTQQKLNICIPLSTSKKQRLQTPYKQKQIKNNIQLYNNQHIHQSNKMLRKYYQTQIQKIQQQHKIQINRLQQKITSLLKQIQKKQTDKQIYYMQTKQYKEKCIKLQNDILSVNDKFNQFLKNIDIQREKQREIYQESIMRLLANIEKRDKESMVSSGLEERSSLGSINLNKKRYRNNQNVKESLSFGSYFQTK